MKSFFEFFIALIALIISLPVFLVILVVGFWDIGSPIFIQTRMGKNKKPFKLIKFRTMPMNTKSVASHLLTSDSISNFGLFLRKSKLDELPQLINILRGEMSFVGPRPNLFNQLDLIKGRSQLGIYDVLPGITGLAQIRNIDMSTPELLAKTDKDMIDTFSVKNYFRYILLTVIGNGKGDAIK